ncbi:hypothetical protein R6Q57_002057 [Mikania cordata]
MKKKENRGRVQFCEVTLRKHQLMKTCNSFELFCITELSHLINLEKLDLSGNSLNATPSIQDCKSLTRLERLTSLSLGHNYFNKSIISCLSFLPSLNTLDLSGSYEIGTSSYPMQGVCAELSSLRELKTLDLSTCGLQLITFNGTMSKLVHLNLDWNFFLSVDDVMGSIAAAFSSLRFLSLEGWFMGGRLFANGLFM